jgi:membrane-associated phospholipid phosphatase
MNFFKACFLVFIFAPLSVFGQAVSRPNPYNLDWKVDAPLFGVGVGAYTGYYFLKKKVAPLTEPQILALNRANVNGFDRRTTYNWSPNAAKASDIMLYTCIASPALLMLDKNIRPDALKVGIISAEVFAVTSALTGLTKVLVRRTRPFVYNPDAPLDKKQKQDARMSFFSGHTSVTSSMCFATAKIYNDYHRGDKSVPYVWAAAALVPAVTGFLRWQAGKHFPTDIIVGYVVGAAVGILVPALHRLR